MTRGMNPLSGWPIRELFSRREKPAAPAATEFTKTFAGFDADQLVPRLPPNREGDFTPEGDPTSTGELNLYEAHFQRRLQCDGADGIEASLTPVGLVYTSRQGAGVPRGSAAGHRKDPSAGAAEKFGLSAEDLQYLVRGVSAAASAHAPSADRRGAHISPGPAGSRNRAPAGDDFSTAMLLESMHKLGPEVHKKVLDLIRNHHYDPGLVIGLKYLIDDSSFKSCNPEQQKQIIIDIGNFTGTGSYKEVPGKFLEALRLRPDPSLRTTTRVDEDFYKACMIRCFGRLLVASVSSARPGDEQILRNTIHSILSRKVKLSLYYDHNRDVSSGYQDGKGIHLNLAMKAPEIEIVRIGEQRARS
jgi:hypothetical protein